LEGTILETSLFHAHQDIAYPIPGFVILASKRHFCALDELTVEEAIEFSKLVRTIRAAQRETLGIETVYCFYNEDTNHHFHLWMMPRYPWMRAFGRSIESVRPALVHARQTMSTDQHRAEVEHAAYKLRDTLSQNNL
jgi:diadenosine tetraphosphate (Ap4A) HIT family hydrolase